MVGGMAGAAIQAARKAIESTYEGVLTVTEHQKVTDEKTKLTDYQEVVVIEGQPCHLSFETLSSAARSESAAAVTYPGATSIQCRSSLGPEVSKVQ